MKRLAGLALGALISVFSVSAYTQSQKLPQDFFKGYERSLKGGGFNYHSPQPDVTSSLLIRSIDSVQDIAWDFIQYLTLGYASSSSGAVVYQIRIEK